MILFIKQNLRWLLGGFLLTFFSAFGQTFFISIWGSEIRAAFDLSHGGFGTVYMVATLASALCLPLVGRLVDVTTVSICAAIVIVILALASFAMVYIQTIPFLVATIFLLRMFGQGMMGHTAITAMGRWYAWNRGKAVSIATVGHQVSEAVMPSLFVLIAAYIGWRMSWLVAAALLVFVALPVIVFLMRVDRTPKGVGDSPESEEQLEVGRQWTQTEVLRDPLFWVVCAGVLSPAFIGTSIWFHQDYLIELNGWRPEVYYSSFALMALTTVCTSLLVGLAVDRWSAIQLLPIFLVPLGSACLVLGNFSSETAIYVTMFLIGTSYGVSSTLFGAIWPETYGVRHLGGVRSIAMALMVFASAAGPGVTGVLIDLGTSFPEQLVYIGLYCLLCTLLMFYTSRVLHMRRKADISSAQVASG